MQKGNNSTNIHCLYSSVYFEKKTLILMLSYQLDFNYLWENIFSLIVDKEEFSL